MKKFALLLPLTLLFSIALTAQCICGGSTAWKQSKIKVGYGTAQMYTCGTPITANCNDTIRFSDGGYQCKLTAALANCVQKTSATLRNSAGVVIQSFSYFNFFKTYFVISTPGSYTLTINTVCGTNKCASCVYPINITCQAATCACDAQGYWQPFTAYTESAPITLHCNGTIFSLKDQSIRIDGGYRCSGNCSVKFSAVLYNSVTGAAVESFPIFNFSWLYTFRTVGKYKLVITPNCNGVSCGFCTLFFVIS